MWAPQQSPLVILHVDISGMYRRICSKTWPAFLIYPPKGQTISQQGDGRNGELRRADPRSTERPPNIRWEGESIGPSVDIHCCREQGLFTRVLTESHLIHMPVRARIDMNVNNFVACSKYRPPWVWLTQQKVEQLTYLQGTMLPFILKDILLWNFWKLQNLSFIESKIVSIAAHQSGLRLQI